MAHSFDITTDSGLLALIDPDAYAAFVDPDWEFRHLMVHFREQMAKRRMLIWCAGLGAEWTVAVASEPSPRTGFREVTGTIVATGGRLALVSYEALTMAADDADYVLPPSHEPHLVTCEPGTYACRIVQLEDPQAVDWDTPNTHLYLELSRTNEEIPVWTQVPWGEDIGV
jgi:hypothetical protein